MDKIRLKSHNRAWSLLLAVTLLAGLLLSACAPAAPRAEMLPTQSAVTEQPQAPDAETEAPVVAEAAATTAPKPADGLAASLSAFGRVISIAEFEPTLAQAVTAAQVEPLLPDPNQMVFLTHPAYADFIFSGYVNERKFQLPFPIEAPRMMVFPRSEFDSFNFESPTDYPTQALALEALLGGSPDFANCGQMSLGFSDDLPFLPPVNSAQVFCARPEIVDFAGGKGVRYLTYYAQGMDPVQDWMVFYTFQGLTSDGQFYVSALFPVRSGVFPYESGQGVIEVGDAYRQKINDQLVELEALDDSQFMPPLPDLDALVAGISIREP